MRPFTEGSVHATFDTIVDKACQEIDTLDNQYVLKASSTELENHFIDKVTIAPLVLHVDEQHIEAQRTVPLDVSHDFRRAIMPGEQASVPGTKVDIAIPYEGERDLWRIRPSVSSLGVHAELDVHGGVRARGMAVQENAVAVCVQRRLSSQELPDLVQGRPPG